MPKALRDERDASAKCIVVKKVPLDSGAPSKLFARLSLLLRHGPPMKQRQQSSRHPMNPQPPGFRPPLSSPTALPYTGTFPRQEPASHENRLDLVECTTRQRSLNRRGARFAWTPEPQFTWIPLRIPPPDTTSHPTQNGAQPRVPRSHLVTHSPCHPFTLSPIHLVTHSPCHPFTLSP